MSVMDREGSPSTRDLRLLAAALPAFGGVVAALAWWSAGALGGAAVFTGVCGLIAAVLDGESGRMEKAWGLLLPGLFGTAWAGATLLGPGPAAAIAIGLGAAGGCAALTAAGPAVYGAWMRAGRPAGWVVSRVLLAAVFYGVITPIGLMLRLGGRDLLGLRLDRGASSYWRVRGPGEGGRYFRQW